MRNEVAFKIARFFYTPFRVLKERIVRRKMAIDIIERYKSAGKEIKKIFYFGIPEHNNLGDIAQTYCTEKWIKDNFSDYLLIEAKTRVTFDKKLNKFMDKVLSKEDIILFQSGYCTRHKNPDHLMHLHIAKYFPKSRLVILPQTVNLNNKRDINSTKMVFANCSRLSFITRDKLSYQFAKEFVEENKLECFPDIVTSLIGRIKLEGNRKGVMLCVRNDKEKYYSDKELKELVNKLKNIYEVLDISDTNSAKTAIEVFNDLEPEVIEKISQFRRYKCIITDRYHGTIFSLIANTPVIVIKTNDHKVISAVEWFNDLYHPYAVRLANNLEEAYKMAKEIRDNDIVLDNTDILYKKYYQYALFELISKK